VRGAVKRAAVAAAAPPHSIDALAAELGRYITTAMAMKGTVVLFLGLASACGDHEAKRVDSPATHPMAVPMPTKQPTNAAADSLLSRYLARIVERDGFTPQDFAGMHSDAEPCVEEQYGDGVSAYWLARGRVLGYVAAGDTLRSRLELLTVADQEPRSDTAYGSVVTARIRTDTLLLKLIPDSSRRAWQICGLLSDGHTFGGYGLPENTRFEPASFSRAKLLRQIDSIRQAPSPR
jgi:hypothetical protein